MEGELKTAAFCIYVVNWTKSEIENEKNVDNLGTDATTNCD